MLYIRHSYCISTHRSVQILLSAVTQSVSIIIVFSLEYIFILVLVQDIRMPSI